MWQIYILVKYVNKLKAQTRILAIKKSEAYKWYYMYLLTENLKNWFLSLQRVVTYSD